MSASENDSSSDTKDPVDEDEGELEENKIVLEHDNDCIALDLNLRYEPKQSPRVILIDIHFLAQIDRAIIPLHKYLLRSLQNVILTELWLEEVSPVATVRVHDTDLLTVAAAGRQSLLYCVPTSFSNAGSLVLFHQNFGYFAHSNVLAAIQFANFVGGAMDF